MLDNVPSTAVYTDAYETAGGSYCLSIFVAFRGFSGHMSCSCITVEDG